MYVFYPVYVLGGTFVFIVLRISCEIYSQNPTPINPFDVMMVPADLTHKSEKLNGRTFSHLQDCPHNV